MGTLIIEEISQRSVAPPWEDHRSLPPLRIGFVTNTYPGCGANSGVGSYIRQLCQSLIQLGHSPSVLLAYSDPPGNLKWDGRVPVHGVAVRGLASNLPYPLGRGPTLLLARELARLAKKLRLDLLEVPESGSLAAPLKAVSPHLPIVVKLTGSAAILRNFGQSRPEGVRARLSKAVLDWQERKSILAADRVVSISTELRVRTSKFFQIPCGEVEIILTPVADDLFNLVDAQASQSEPLVLLVGRLEWRKGQDLVVRALPMILQRHPNVRLCLVGADLPDGPGGKSMLSYLRSLLPEEAWPHIQFLGDIANEHLLEMYSRATLCVVPSRYEGLGVACQEAMACGKAVVVSTAAAFRELVTHQETGLIVRRDEPEEFAACVDTLLSDAALRARLGAAARARAERLFRGTVVARAMVCVYREVIEAKKRSRPIGKET